MKQKRPFLLLILLIIVTGVVGYIGLGGKNLLGSVINAEESSSELAANTQVDEVIKPLYFLKPTSTDNLSKTGNVFEFGVVNPGSVLKGSFALTLTNNIESEYDVFLVSATKFDDSDKMGTWLKLDGASKIKLNEIDNKKELSFSISLPQDLLPGEYRALLQAILGSYKGHVLSPGANPVKIGSAIKITFSIPGDRTYNLILSSATYESIKLEAEKKLALHLEYENEGNTKIYPSLHISATGGGGANYLEKTVDGNECKSKNTCTYDMTEALNGIKQLDKITIKGELYYSTTPNGEKILAGTFSTVHYIVEWSYVYIAFGLLSLLLAIFFYSRGRRLILLEGSESYTVVEGDSLEIVAKKFNVDPNKIIFINRLKVPYFLATGLLLHIPKK